MSFLPLPVTRFLLRWECVYPFLLLRHLANASTLLLLLLTIFWVAYNWWVESWLLKSLVEPEQTLFESKLLKLKVSSKARPFAIAVIAAPFLNAVVHVLINSVSIDKTGFFTEGEVSTVGQDKLVVSVGLIYLLWGLLVILRSAALLVDWLIIKVLRTEPALRDW
jgi:hypothetical protein